jgi:hypothetical protein
VTARVSHPIDLADEAGVGHTECRPHGTLAEFAVPDSSVETEALCHCILVDDEGVHKTVIDNSTVMVSFFNRKKLCFGAYA